MKKILSLSLLWFVWMVVVWCGGAQQADPAPQPEVKPAVEAPAPAPKAEADGDFGTQSANNVNLASCLTDKWFKMYGTERCGHCKKQKETIGADFASIDYIDCDKDSAACTTAGIQWYPTWVDGNGQAFPGGKTLDQLKTLSGC